MRLWDCCKEMVYSADFAGTGKEDEECRVLN